MEKIPTAEEFLDEVDAEYFPGEVYGEFAHKREQVIERMQEFAKLHVKAALEAAHIAHQVPEEDMEYTLNAYPLNLIK
jgi:hypothetical protein